METKQTEAVRRMLNKAEALAATSPAGVSVVMSVILTAAQEYANDGFAWDCAIAKSLLDTPLVEHAANYGY